MLGGIFACLVCLGSSATQFLQHWQIYLYRCTSVCFPTKGQASLRSNPLLLLSHQEVSPGEKSSIGSTLAALDPLEVGNSSPGKAVEFRGCFMGPTFISVSKKGAKHNKTNTKTITSFYSQKKRSGTLWASKNMDHNVTSVDVNRMEKKWKKRWIILDHSCLINVLYIRYNPTFEYFFVFLIYISPPHNPTWCDSCNCVDLAGLEVLKLLLWDEDIFQHQGWKQVATKGLTFLAHCPVEDAKHLRQVAADCWKTSSAFSLWPSWATNSRLRSSPGIWLQSDPEWFYCITFGFDSKLLGFDSNIYSITLGFAEKQENTYNKNPKKVLVYPPASFFTITWTNTRGFNQIPGKCPAPSPRPNNKAPLHWPKVWKTWRKVYCRRPKKGQF